VSFRRYCFGRMLLGEPPVPAPTLSRLELDRPTVVDVPLRAVVRVEVPPAGTPARRLWTITDLEAGS